ncbi:RDD family protein [Metabacillus arenae]|uniref:RDD family protein n=1 Tax=Metabacillus arenae TaxID=2771434 RepID=A0A926NLB2_9BACI|nr:RDD family protein [Metabacillus arenae]MBD1380127.1 RDD family protein [Metabacillus arenae]
MDATYEEVNDPKRPVDETPKDLIEKANGGFWIRFWAYLLDLAVVASINSIVVVPLFTLAGLETNGSSMFSPISILKAMIFFLYFVLMTKYLNQTLGKMIFGLRVISLKENNEGKLPWSTVIFREFIGRYVSKTIWIGYVIVAFTNKKQGLHDIFADTTVIHESLFQRKNKG